MTRMNASLEQIAPDKIRPNPDNPRLIFHEEDMQELLESIKAVGIKVPVSLYQDGQRFVLIDGERRWRCAKKLNLQTVPAIVQPKPTPLQNLLMMFNIHNVRVDWDLMPMALKLREVRDLLEKERQPTNPKALSSATGVALPTVRRALDLLDLPQKYQHLLLKEAQKPRAEQKIKADLFVEIYKSLHAVERHAPEVLQSVTKPQYIESMVQKYVDDVVDNVVAYRDVSKIARAELAGTSKRDAIPVLVKLVRSKSYSVKDAYHDTVESAYERRELLSRLESFTKKLGDIKTGSSLTPEVTKALQRLRSEIDRILER